MLKQRPTLVNAPVISSALANTPCPDFGIDGVLEKLNATLGTSYTLRSRILRLLRIVQLHSILEPYVTRNDDFGTVYAHLRPYWYDYDVATINATYVPGKRRTKRCGEGSLSMTGSPSRTSPLGACGIYVLIGWCHTGFHTEEDGESHMRGWTRRTAWM